MMVNKSESEYRKDIIEVCKRVYRNGWVASNDGNVSIKMDDNLILCTPTGMSKGYLTTDQLVKVDFEGNKVEGELSPSSEVKMHIDVYKNRSDINSVVHAHPATATGFAVAGIPLDQCIIPEIIVSIGSVPLTKYGTPSTEEIPNNIRKYLPKHNVFLLENHGALSIGADVYEAYYKMESLELFAKIYLVAKQLGQVNILSEENVKRMIKLREDWGMDEHYAGCRINGKVVDQINYNDNSNNDNDDEMVTLSKKELTSIVTNIVSNILNKGS